MKSETVSGLGFSRSNRSGHSASKSGVQDVGDQVAEQGQDRKEGHIEHREGNVARHHRVVGGVADAGDREERLGDQRPREQSGKRAADDGHERDQGVAEGVMVDDLALGQPLGARRPDIVGVQDLEHIGTGVAHQGTDADDHQRRDGHHEMLRLIEELADGVELVVVPSDKPEQVEPAEFDAEQQF